MQANGEYLTKDEHIKYWLDTAAKDWKAAQQLFKAKSYIHALFFGHLYLEKLCKALWVKNNDSNTPPKVHNLVKILNETGIEYSAEQMDFMIIMNNFQLEGRYPDYQQRLFKMYKAAKTQEILKQVKTFGKWLREQ